MSKLLIDFCRDEKAATAIEYAIVAGGIALAIIVAVKALGTSTSGNFDAVRTALSG